MTMKAEKYDFINDYKKRIEKQTRNITGYQDMLYDVCEATLDYLDELERATFSDEENEKAHAYFINQHLKYMLKFNEEYLGRLKKTNEVVEPEHPQTGEDIERPKRYQMYDGRDIIDIMAENMLGPDGTISFLQCNIIKYIMRYRNKGGITDLEKARVCIGRMIEIEESQMKGGGKRESGRISDISGE